LAGIGRDEDIFQRFEKDLRTPQRRSPLDAFLPAAETLESAVAPPPTPEPTPMPEPAANDFGALADIDRDPEPPPRPRAKRKRSAPLRAEKPKSLQEEITEFMNRDRPQTGVEEDLSAWTTGMDPNSDPDKDP